jgi:hypothetical protein
MSYNIVTTKYGPFFNIAICNPSCSVYMEMWWDAVSDSYASAFYKIMIEGDEVG